MARALRLDRYDWSQVQYGNGAPDGDTKGNIYVNNIGGVNQGLYIKVGGAWYHITSGSGILGPNPSVEDSVSIWANTTGTQLDDSYIKYADSTFRGFTILDTNTDTTYRNMIGTQYYPANGLPQGQYIEVANSYWETVIRSLSTVYIATQGEYIGLSHDGTDNINVISKGGVKFYSSSPVTLADDASFDLPDASAGWGIFCVGGAHGAGDEGAGVAIVCWDDVATVTIITTSVAGFASADSDGDFCFFDNGTAVRVRNRTGSTMDVQFTIQYMFNPTGTFYTAA